ILPLRRDQSARPNLATCRRLWSTSGPGKVPRRPGRRKPKPSTRRAAEDRPAICTPFPTTPQRRCRMAPQPTPPSMDQKAEQGEQYVPPRLDEPIPVPDDPGGAHAKGYSADPDEVSAGKENDQVGVVSDPDQPERR